MQQILILVGLKINGFTKMETQTKNPLNLDQYVA